MKREGMKPLDLSENEMAKSHARYLVGGRSSVKDERVFRFEFPERPGALRKFLEAMRFNISLFHYRNQGGGAFSSSSRALRSPLPSFPSSFPRHPSPDHPSLLISSLTSFPPSYRCRQNSRRDPSAALRNGRLRGVAPIARLPLRRGDGQSGVQGFPGRCRRGGGVNVGNRTS